MPAEFFCREISVYFRNCPEVRAAPKYISSYFQPLRQTTVSLCLLSCRQSATGRTL